MRRLTMALAVAALACIAHADSITLKEEVYVKGPKVLLGEVADIDGQNRVLLEQVELASAALPGAFRRVNASLVRSRLRSSGIDVSGIEISGALTTRATTLYQEVPQDIIAESLRCFVESEMPWDPFDTDVEVQTPAQAVIVPDGDLALVWRPSPQYDYAGTGTFRCRVSVDGRVHKSLTCRATVEPYGQVVVARQDIPRGAVVSPSQITVEKRRLSSLNRTGLFRDAEQLRGMVARGTIFAGEVLTTRKVTPRKVVKRNQVVVVEARVRGLHLQTRARARSDGGIGDVILLENLDSKQTFEAVICEDGSVVVP